jgi:hypothetical protein
MKCPHCKSELLWSEDRGPHCDGCDCFDFESDLPNNRLRAEIADIDRELEETLFPKGLEQ